MTALAVLAGACVLALSLSGGVSAVAPADTVGETTDDRLTQQLNATGSSNGFEDPVAVQPSAVAEYIANTPGQVDSSANLSAEYVNCTAARITGEFEGVTYDAGYNINDGVDEGSSYIAREQLSTNSDGSVTVTSIWSGLNGTVLYYVFVNTENGSQELLGAEDQDERCFRRVRPDVNVSLDSVSQISPGTYNVTFVYMNNHSRDLYVNDASFNGRIAGDVTPPERLLPGRNTVSVEWTPANESERLTWRVGLNGRFIGYDEAVRVQTNPASQYAPGPTTRTVRIEAPPDAEVFSYTLRVDGDAAFGPAANPGTADSISANQDGTVTIRGTVGLGSGDSYRFSGDIVCGSLDGPGEVIIDGELRSVDSCSDPPPESETLRIEADPDAEVFSYNIRIDGDAELGSEADPGTDDSVTRNPDGTVTVSGTAGLGGVDTYRITGDIICGSLGGAGDVLLDGERVSLVPCDDSPDLERLVRIEAPPDAEVFTYTLRVDGDAEFGPAANPETEDSVTDNEDGTVTIRGTVGLGSGDSYRFSGDIICGSLDGPGEVLVDGRRSSVEPCSDPPPESETLRINAEPDAEVFSYRIRVDGDAELGRAANPETGDSVTRNPDGTVTVSGTVGLGGGDTYEITGEVVCGSLDGPGEVLLDGEPEQVEPCD